MAFVNMYSELNGSIPKIPIDYCKTLVNRAWADVRRQNMWSFNMFEANWITPPLLNTGTASVTRGSTSVVLDATAAAAVVAALDLPTPIIQRQFRCGIGTIYNIYAWNALTSTLTLDRAYSETTSATATYTIFQCYYPTPMSDFFTFLSVRDMNNFTDLFTHRYNREALDAIDPNRTWYYFPTDVIFAGMDLNPLSATYRYPMFELWGHPQYTITYQLYGVRKGVDLSSDADELPPQIGEDCVIALARQYAYESAAANMGDLPRNQGPDWKFLIGAASADYRRLLREYRRQDREICNNWFTIRRQSLYGKFWSYYSTLSSTGYPGAIW